MQIPEQDYLDLMEQTCGLCFFDLEASGLRGDYNSVLVVSVKPYGKKPDTFTVIRPGNDQKVVREAKACLESYRVWCGYYSKGFDIPMLNTRLLRWGQFPIEKRHHLDLYYMLRKNILTARRSQGHILSWLGTEQQKMTVSAEVWNEILAHPKQRLPEMMKRCESDCAGLEALYRRTRHVIGAITR